MAFSFVKFSHEVRIGDLRMVLGTFSNTEGSTGGIIQTGLHYVNSIELQYTGSAVIADAPVINSPSVQMGGKPRLEPDVEIVTTADACGLWIVTGK
jgi:hypothetical protein